MTPETQEFEEDAHQRLWGKWWLLWHDADASKPKPSYEEWLENRLEEAERAAHSLDVLCNPMVAMYFPSIRFVIDELLAALAGEETITDDLGNTWPAACPECGGKMSVVRPGKVQCSRCG